jgi:hypothetical protein
LDKLFVTYVRSFGNVRNATMAQQDYEREGFALIKSNYNNELTVEESARNSEG